MGKMLSTAVWGLGGVLRNRGRERDGRAKNSWNMHEPQGDGMRGHARYAKHCPRVPGWRCLP